MDTGQTQSPVLLPKRGLASSASVSFERGALTISMHSTVQSAMAEERAIEQQLLILQLCDSAFPSGGFANSAGLEAAVATKFVSDSNTLHCFLLQAAENVAASALPLVRAACDAAMAEYAQTPAPATETAETKAVAATSDSAEGAGAVDQKGVGLLSRVCELDALAESITTTNAVANKASKEQGRSWLHAVSEVFGLGEGAREAQFRTLKAATKQRTATATAAHTRTGTATQCHGHFAPLFGASCGLLGLDSRTAQQMFLFASVRSIVSAAVRLNVVGNDLVYLFCFDLTLFCECACAGPQEAQRVQQRVSGPMALLLSRAAKLSMEAALDGCGLRSPLPDVLQSVHSRLHTRLFRS